MVNQVSPNAPAIGGCLRCHQIFLITDTSAACLICGRAPDLSLPFNVVVYTPDFVDLVPAAAAAEPEAPILIAVKCPHCDKDVQLSITDTEISVAPPFPGPPVDEVGPDSAPSPEPASSPAVEPPPPAMATNVFGHPIEGPPPPPAPLESTTEASPGSVGERQGAAAPSAAPEEPPA